jgi:hypothetical protein
MEGRKAGWTGRRLVSGRRLVLSLLVLGEEDGAEDAAAFGAQDLREGGRKGIVVCMYGSGRGYAACEKTGHARGKYEISQLIRA